MAVKSVVDIDLDDEKFSRFTALYGKYQDALKKQPGQWKDAEKAAGGVDEAVNKVLAAFLTAGQFQRELTEAGEKDNKNLKQKASLWEKIQKSSTGVLKDVEGVSKWMLKWGGIGFGLSLGGLFGLRAIAEDVAGQRNRALGLDLGTGQPEAFGRHQGRYFQDQGQGLLSGAFAAKSGYGAEYAVARSLGIDTNQSTVAIADALLTKLQAMTKAMPEQSLGNLIQEYPALAAFGISQQSLQQLRTVSSSELQGQIAAYGPDARNAGLGAKQAQAFTDFVSSIDTTFAAVTKEIEKDLVPLLGPIQRFVRSVGQDLSILLKSKAATEGIDAFAKAIDRFASYVGSGNFKADVQGFADGVEKVGASLHAFAHPIDTYGGAATDTYHLFQDWAEEKKREAKGLDSPGFIPNMREYLRTHGGSEPLIKPLSLPTPAAMKALVTGAHVKISLLNATGANVHASVNALNGGVG